MIRTVSVILFVICTVLLGSSPTWAATARYDVSYLWHSRLDNVYTYRQQVARVLGPGVSKRLRVVRKKSGLYGLIYQRKGDNAGARRVALTHSRLLRSRGLESAAPIRSMNWASLSPSTVSNRTPVSSKTKETNTRPREMENLSAAVEQYIKSMRRKGRISKDERTAWSVYDFTTGKKLVGINEDVQFQAASLIKPFFVMGFFHKVRKGGLIYGPKSRRHMERMIQHSNNRSTNWVLRQVGGPRAMHKILRTHYPQIFRDTHIVEYIPSNGRTYRNKASAHDYSRFLYALWHEDIPGAREIKRLMSLPGPDRLYTGARSIPKGTKVYNKTGSTARLCGDMGILVVKGKNGKRYPYTLVGVIEKRGRARNYGSWIRSRGNVIRRVSNLVYSGISQQHGLRSL